MKTTTIQKPIQIQDAKTLYKSQTYILELNRTKYLPELELG